MRQSSEHILCSAIWYKELPTQTFLPKNVDKGIVVTGLRHAHCIDIVKSLSGLRTVKLSPDGVGESEQGFLTNHNRFVSREEGLIIALRENQVLDKKEIRGDRLFSEDIY